MCGIAGFCDFNKKSSLETLKQMTDVLAHRGPDDHDYFFCDTGTAQIGLGHRRLSILDLSPLGHQPMKFGKSTIVFNGEIYNFKEIREELKKEGYSFQSDSDTEVILKSFARWGVSAVQKYIGMFAFVLYREEEDKIYVFRDRAGVKPLYFQWYNNLFLFASELKSFHVHQDFIKELDVNSLSLYLQYSYIPAPHTIFKHTFKLRPGHFLTIDLKNKGLQENKYWDVFEHYNQPKLKISEEDAVSETEKLLKSAYEYRMVADVPVGVFLSGGYDSSSVAAILQTNRTEKIKTFTIGYEEESFNESHEAKAIANFLGTDHTEFIVRAKDASDVIPKLPDIYDEPFADNSVVPTFLVSRLARQYVTVALSADGGDEVFAGYNKFNQSRRFTESIPVWIQILMSRSMEWINPDHIPYLSKKYNFSTRYEKMKKIWAAHSPVVAMKIISQYITEKETSTFLSKEFIPYHTAFDDGSLLRDNNDSINKLLAVDYKTFLVDNNLVKVDRATMAVSLEGREPILDHRLIEFVSRLPSELKIKNGVNKYILKTIVHKYIPEEMMNRPKKPFIAPLTIWFKRELKEMMSHYISERALQWHGLFKQEEIIKLRNRYFQNENVNHQKLWNILLFQVWYERWMLSK